MEGQSSSSGAGTKGSDRGPDAGQRPASRFFRAGALLLAVVALAALLAVATRGRESAGGCANAVGTLAPSAVLAETTPGLQPAGDLPTATSSPTAERLVVERQLGELSGSDVGNTVKVEGVLRLMQTLPAGILGTLDDGTGTARLLLWQDVVDDLPHPARLVRGAVLRIEGEVSQYGGELEISPQTAAGVAIVGLVNLPAQEPAADKSPTREALAGADPDATPGGDAAGDEAAPSPTPTLAPTPQPAVAPTATSPIGARSIGSIDDGDVGSWLVIDRAEIAEIIYFSKGVQYRLVDGSGSIILLLWQNLLEEVPDRYDLLVGSRLQVAGRIDEYQGDLEIVPGKGKDVVVVAPVGRLPSEERSAGSIVPADEGRIVVVEGTVVQAESSQWLKWWLDDGTGQILVYVPQRVVEYLPAGIGVGVRLRVTGEVDIYRGEIEIIPLAGDDVKVR